jgi:hypothetical protein
MILPTNQAYDFHERIGRKKVGRGCESQETLMKDSLQKVQRALRQQEISQLKRRVPFGDLITDRSQNAAE